MVFSLFGNVQIVLQLLEFYILFFESLLVLVHHGVEFLLLTPLVVSGLLPSCQLVRQLFVSILIFNEQEFQLVGLSIQDRVHILQHFIFIIHLLRSRFGLFCVEAGIEVVDGLVDGLQKLKVSLVSLLVF